jgi:hypothetical protein
LRYVLLSVAAKMFTLLPATTAVPWVDTTSLPDTPALKSNPSVPNETPTDPDIPLFVLCCSVVL